MVYDIVYVIGLELVKDRYNHGTIGDGSQEGNSPMRTVTATDGNLVSLVNAALFKDDVQFLDFTSYILIL